MDRAAFESHVREILGPDRLRAGVPLAPFTTFRVGGPADWLGDVRTQEELVAVTRAASAAGVPLTVLGSGSNVVIADGGIPGLVLRLHLTHIERHGADDVRAEAGVTMNGLVRWTIGRGLAGLEAWAGTPGTLGGAVHGNAHWGGRNVSDLVVHVGLLSADGDLVEVPADRMEFAYDASRVQRTGEIVVFADVRVSPGVSGALRDRARVSLAYRKRTQPLAQPSAGCVFQNPDPAREVLPAGVPASAGALVDRAGLKGYRVGGAVISTTHANFVVNDGAATARDIRELVTVARAAVEEQFGIVLRDEVRYLGTF